ncbi:MAG: hypothetical protein IJN54_10855, partial [Lachnospiraceae bacterium]|nr:hypothetical protein [Lachnospiraceae bacterium]
GKSANAFSKFLEIIEKPRKRYYNEGGRMEKEVLQWHPAFYAGLQIELEDKGMCKALEELMADVIAKREKEAIERGMEQGMAQGREQEMRSVVSNMLKKKMSDEDICEIAECDREYVDMVRKSIA